MFDMIYLAVIIIGLLLLMVGIGCAFEIKEYIKYRRTVKKINEAKYKLNKDQCKYFTDLK
jgi:hypothetical protein